MRYRCHLRRRCCPRRGRLQGYWHCRRPSECRHDTTQSSSRFPTTCRRWRRRRWSARLRQPRLDSQLRLRRTRHRIRYRFGRQRCYRLPRRLRECWHYCRLSECRHDPTRSGSQNSRSCRPAHGRLISRRRQQGLPSLQHRTRHKMPCRHHRHRQGDRLLRPRTRHRRLHCREADHCRHRH